MFTVLLDVQRTPLKTDDFAVQDLDFHCPSRRTAKGRSHCPSRRTLITSIIGLRENVKRSSPFKTLQIQSRSINQGARSYEFIKKPPFKTRRSY